jgi:hypothetical protein
MYGTVSLVQPSLMYCAPPIVPENSLVGAISTTVEIADSTEPLEA